MWTQHRPLAKTELWLDGSVDTTRLYGPSIVGLSSVGALYKRRGLVITPQISGGAST